MQIWLDGDACPKVIREILWRAVQRTCTPVTVVSNHFVPKPASAWIKSIHVEVNIDAADNHIVTHMQAGDLVITADIPLADSVVTQGGLVLNMRGDFYSQNNIKYHLTLRNLNESLRSNGLISGGPAKLSAQNIRQFSNKLDAFLAKH